MSVSFRFREYNSSIFGKIRRPVAEVFIQHKKDKSWQPIAMLVDTDADYTLLPKFLAEIIGIDLSVDCRRIETQGVGGYSDVYLLREKITVRLGEFKRNIPIGFLDSDSIPPFLGRQEFFETFRVVFENHTVAFED